MSLDVFRAYLNGYADRLFDFQLLGVKTGFWSAYFSRDKKPKSLTSILNSMINDRMGNQQGGMYQQKNKHEDEVDVQAFLERDRIFREKIEQLRR